MKKAKKTRLIAIVALGAAAVGVIAAAAWSRPPVGEGKAVNVMMTPT